MCPICERVMLKAYLKRHMRKRSHAIREELETVREFYVEKLSVEKLSAETGRKHNDIMSTILEPYLAIMKHYSSDTYLCLRNTNI